MKPWAWTEERLAAALGRVREFEGTPHIHRRSIPGVGVDCIHLVYEALVAAGVAPEVLLPHYRRTDGFNQHDNYLQQHFSFAFHSEVIPGDVHPAEGDVVVFRIKRSVNHCGIFLGGEIWHSAYGSGCYPEQLGATEFGAQSYVRIIGEGYKNDPRTDPAVNFKKR